MVHPRLVAVFGASAIAASDPEWEEAERCGRLLAEHGYTVVTGGYGGVMEAVSAGADNVGGFVVGHTAPAVFPQRIGANPFVQIEVTAGSLTERIHSLITTADAVIALPGSLGTFTELVTAWNVAHVTRDATGRPLPVVAVGDRWRRLFGLLEDELRVDADVVTFVDTAAEAVRCVAGRLETVDNPSV